jgi:hypothetical protein
MGEFLSIGDLIELHPGDATLLVGFVSPDAHIVFSGTGNHARATTGAFVQIDDHTIFVFTLFLFHSLPRSKKWLMGVTPLLFVRAYPTRLSARSKGLFPRP